MSVLVDFTDIGRGVQRRTFWLVEEEGYPPVWVCGFAGSGEEQAAWDKWKTGKPVQANKAVELEPGMTLLHPPPTEGYGPALDYGEMETDGLTLADPPPTEYERAMSRKTGATVAQLRKETAEALERWAAPGVASDEKIEAIARLGEAARREFVGGWLASVIGRERAERMMERLDALEAGEEFDPTEEDQEAVAKEMDALDQKWKAAGELAEAVLAAHTQCRTSMTPCEQCKLAYRVLGREEGGLYHGRKLGTH